MDDQIESVQSYLQQHYGAGDPDCPHAEITAQYMASGQVEPRCHACMALITPGPDEALLPSLVRSSDQGTGGLNTWKTMGYRLVRLGAVTVEPRMKVAGGGFVAQTAIRSRGEVRILKANGSTRLEAMQALEALARHDGLIRDSSDSQNGP